MTICREKFGDARQRTSAADGLPRRESMETVTSAKVDEALSRLKGRYLEVPTTTLSVEQASQLTALDEVTCLALLLALERCRFLRRSSGGDFLLNALFTSADLEVTD